MRDYPPAALLILLVAVALAIPVSTAHAQSVRVDSRIGYVLRVTKGAVLDSAHSGWSVKKMFERRVYRLDGVGEIRVTATVKPPVIPVNAVISEAYKWYDSDSATSGGTAIIRTYYLPTRSVRIELIPYGSRMRAVIEAREAIYKTFRWKPGAESDRVDVDAQ